jgi:hypothetical protein
MGTAERTGWLCRQSGDGELEQLAAQAGAAPLLARIRAAALAGGAGPSDQDLDSLDEALARIGVVGATTPDSDRAYRPLPPASGHPLVHARVCPRRVCARAEPDGPDGPAPGCALTGLPLERLRLPT